MVSAALNVVAAIVLVRAWLRRRRASDASGDGRTEREHHALEINDNVVQGLTEAQLALDLGRTDQARDAIERTLGAARQLVTALLGDLGPGDLRRSAPADQPRPKRTR